MNLQKHENTLREKSNWKIEEQENEKWRKKNDNQIEKRRQNRVKDGRNALRIDWEIQ